MTEPGKAPELEGKALVPQGYAPGNYSCRCSFCAQDFIGDKRAVSCELCALRHVFQRHTRLLSEADTYSSGLRVEITTLKDRVKQLEELENRHEAAEMGWAQSCYEKELDISSLKTKLAESQQLVKDHEEVQKDHLRLVRELDVAFNGEEGAAKQASLCDLIREPDRLRANVHHETISSVVTVLGHNELVNWSDTVKVLGLASLELTDPDQWIKAAVSLQLQNDIKAVLSKYTGDKPIITSFTIEEEKP